MREITATVGTDINLGRRGEHLATSVNFDFSGWITTHGEGSVQLIHQRNGDREPYPIALDVSDGVATWVVTNSDVAVAGRGWAELRYFVNDVRVKSQMYATVTERALGARENAPAAYQTWVDNVLAAAVETEENASQAAQYALSASGDAADAQMARMGAETAQAAAEAAKSAAETAATNAAESEAMAEGYMDGAQAAQEAAEAARDEARQIAGADTPTYRYVDDHDATTLQSAKDYADAVIEANPAVRDNLLHNWYFPQPINSRGQSQYNDGWYTIDRWKAEDGMVVDLVESGVKLTVADGWVSFKQDIDPKDLAPMLGREVTISFLVHSVEAGQIKGFLRLDGVDSQINPLAEGINSLTFTMPNSVTAASMIVQTRGAATATITAMKLEIGEGQTLGDDANVMGIPENQWLEYLKCIQSTADSSDGESNKTISTTDDTNWRISEQAANRTLSNLTDAESARANLGATPDGIRALGIGASCTDIAENADLNSYTTVGNYRAANTALAETLANSPTDVAFVMCVMAATGTAESMENPYSYLRQIVFDLNNNVHMRTVWVNDDVAQVIFGDWVKVYTSAAGPTPADIGAAPAYTYGTTDLTAGTSALTTGTMYLVYE